jgi:uncharacterized protein (DUF2344 family)
MRFFTEAPHPTMRMSILDAVPVITRIVGHSKPARR